MRSPLGFNPKNHGYSRAIRSISDLFDVQIRDLDLGRVFRLDKPLKQG